MGKMGDTWRWVDTSTKTGETDKGVTTNDWLKRIKKERHSTNFIKAHLLIEMHSR